MSSESRLFSLSTAIASQIRDFRLKGHKLGGTAYIAFSIKKATHEIASDEVVVVEEGIDELADELPDNTPRYVLVSYAMTHADGRQANPLFLIYWIPRTASTELATLYVCLSIYIVSRLKNRRAPRSGSLSGATSPRWVSSCLF